MEYLKKNKENFFFDCFIPVSTKRHSFARKNIYCVYLRTLQFTNFKFLNGKLFTLIYVRQFTLAMDRF